MYKYHIRFRNKEELIFTSEINIDFHKLQRIGLMSFDDLLINMEEIAYMSKKEVK